MIRSNGADEKVTVIRPPEGRSPIDFGELARYRGLLYFLVWRDVKVKYKQTFVGIAWAVFQPTVIAVVFSVFFGLLAGVPSDDIPYPLFSFIGLVPWIFFATAVNFSSTSLVANAPLLTKIYFPRLLLPTGAVVAALLDLAIGVAFLFVVVLAFGFGVDARAVWLVPFTLLAIVAALGCGFFLSATNARFRDVQYAVPFFVQVGLFVTPVVYPSSLVPENLRFLLGLNPMAAVVEGYRWALTDKPLPSMGMIATSVVVAAALLAFGAYYFRRAERDFADVV